jgi:hypothetical protein
MTGLAGRPHYNAGNQTRSASAKVNTECFALQR